MALAIQLSPTSLLLNFSKSTIRMNSKTSSLTGYPVKCMILNIDKIIFDKHFLGSFGLEKFKSKNQTQRKPLRLEKIKNDIFEKNISLNSRLQIKNIFPLTNFDFLAPEASLFHPYNFNQEITQTVRNSIEVPVMPPDDDSPSTGPMEFPPFSTPSEVPTPTTPDIPTIPSQPEIPLPEVPHGPSVPIPNTPPVTPPGTPPPSPMPEVPPNTPPGYPPLTPPPQMPPIVPDFPTPPPAEEPQPEVNPPQSPPSGYFEIDV